MGMMINRRRACGGKNYDPLILIHYWEAADWNGGNTWVDSVGGIILTKVGTPTKTTIDDNVVVGCNSYHYFTCNMNAAAPQGFDFGDEFKVIVECIYGAATDNLDRIILDFGSFIKAEHSFGVVVKTNGQVTFNTKLSGNDSYTLYDPCNSTDTFYGVLKKVTFGIKRTGDLNICYSQINDEIEIYGPNPCTRVDATFNRNFDTNILYLGRPSTTNIIYISSVVKYIKSIKIYKLL